jgi:hypothetical protein
MKQTFSFIRSAPLGLLLFLNGWMAGCSGERMAEPTEPVPVSAHEALREQWGIETAGLHLSAKGRMIDFRYRVLDAEKASRLSDRNVKPTLTDLATGAVLHVPSFPKIGTLRQTSAKPAAEKVYFIIFANTGMPVKPGSRVTVAIGDFKAENLIVE